MDVKKTKTTKRRFKREYIFAAAAVAVVALLVSNISTGPSVKRSDILLSTVKSGDLEVKVEGYGTLVSRRKQLLTAMSDATVKEILLRPGALVKRDSVIVTMENSELKRQVESEKWQLASLKANLRQLKLSNERELLDEQAKIEQVSSDFEAAKLKTDIEASLIEGGTVAKLTFEQSKLSERQLKRRLEILKRRYDKLVDAHQEALKIQGEQIKQQESKLASAQERLDQLIVKAPMDGVLQTLSVELGQRLSNGEQIAQIGSMTDLVALIKVPQSQAQDIAIGQQAQVNAQGDVINGKVVRVDPVVAENTIDVEIAFDGELPKSLRPQMNVDGSITTATLDTVVYMERPANVRANTSVQLYRMDSDLTAANIQQVRFGRLAGRYVEVVDGAEVADQFIVSGLQSLAQNGQSLRIE